MPNKQICPAELSVKQVIFCMAQLEMKVSAWLGYNVCMKLTTPKYWIRQTILVVNYAATRQLNHRNDCIVYLVVKWMPECACVT